MTAWLVITAAVWGGAGCLEAPPIEGARCDDTRLCPEPLECVSGRCKQVDPDPTCAIDDDCDIGYCLPQAEFCVQCYIDEHCGGESCFPDRNWTCGCTTDDDCATGLCGSNSGRVLSKCLACQSDQQCASGYCDENTGICEKPRRRDGHR